MRNAASTIRFAFVLILLITGMGAGARAVHSSAQDTSAPCYGYAIC